jgi:hypothetical protein
MKREMEFVDTDAYQGPERRKEVHITDAQIERIAAQAAEKAVQHVLDTGYRVVGRNVIEKGIWLVGAVSCGLFAYFASKGWIKM